jgi:N-acetylglucosaminylphosphatidylinositol deacetylase
MWSLMRGRMSSWIASSVPHRMPRKVLRLLPRVLLVILIAPLLLQILIAYIIGDDARLLPPALQRAQNLLIVTAHPDDECLFFAPSILGVLDRNPDTVGGLLVLSTGESLYL